jgi:hypothetical protein
LGRVGVKNEEGRAKNERVGRFLRNRFATDKRLEMRDKRLEMRDMRLEMRD